MVPRVLVDQRDTVFVQPVVEFLVDGVEINDTGVGNPDAELEKEVWVPEQRLVDVEGLLVEGRGGHARWWEKDPGCGRRWRLLDTPDDCCNVAAAVLMATQDAQYGSTLGRRNEVGRCCR